MNDQLPFYDSVRAGIQTGSKGTEPVPEPGPVFPGVTVSANHPLAGVSGRAAGDTAARQSGRPRPAALLIAGIAVVLMQLIVISVWFGSGLRTEALETINSTLAKLSVIEKHGYDVRRYYAKIRNNANVLRSPFSALIPLTVQSVHAEVREVDSEVTAQFGQVLAEQRKMLAGRINVLTKQLDAAADYPYPAKESVVAEVAGMKADLADGEIDASQMTGYTARLDELEKTVARELISEFDRAFGELENKYSVAVNFDYPSRDMIESYIAAHGSRAGAGDPELENVLDRLASVARYSAIIDREVEEEKRQLIFTNITNTTREVDSLLAFFSTRSGYLAEISQLNRYKDNVSGFQPSNFSDSAASEMQKRAESELFALMELPRKSKAAAEEKERLELIARQKKLLEENDIPLPPLDAPKLIYVDLAKQRLYAYENGISIFTEPVPVTTGKRGFETVTGRYAIYLKYSPFRMRSPFPGIYYDNMVDYFMPFYQGYGFHDASWRSIYGTPDYLDAGSHGCINTPYTYIRQLYYWAEIGTAVLVK